VLAVDPTSPFSGGAILGDRVRMGQHALDPTVFIRSMATRGHLGGLSLAVPDAIRLLGAAATVPWTQDADGLHVAEVCLRPGEPSRLPCDGAPRTGGGDPG